MYDPLVEWQKVWFFLRNDTNASLPVFMGSRPVPQPKWRYDVAQQYIRRLQPLCDVIGRLLRGRLMDADLLQTFVSRCVQPLQRWEMTMWMYLGPSCPDRSFSIELDDTEIKARI
jgi:hypothetical protein